MRAVRSRVGSAQVRHPNLLRWLQVAILAHPHERKKIRTPALGPIICQWCRSPILPGIHNTADRVCPGRRRKGETLSSVLRKKGQKTIYLKCAWCFHLWRYDARATKRCVFCRSSTGVGWIELTKRDCGCWYCTGYGRAMGGSEIGIEQKA